MRSFSRREWMVAAGTGVIAASHAAQAAEVKIRTTEMVAIPAGPFLMGTTETQARGFAETYGYHISWFNGEVPQRTVNLPAFSIDKFPVTNRQYAEFCAATQYAPPRHWGGPQPPEGIREHPVTMVNKADAQAYAKWAGKRLPTEAEWEKAARGTEGLLFPWGNRFDVNLCQWDNGGAADQLGTAPVTAHIRGASPYGVVDMIGNAAEWCADGPGKGSAYVKGGCWLTGRPVNLRCASRIMSGFDNNTLAFCGFRCAKDAV